MNRNGGSDMKRYIGYVLGLVISSFGSCLMIKMTLGQSTFNAFSYGLFLVTGIKIGYISILYNISVLLLEMMLLNTSFHKIQILQIIPGFISGFILNFFVYNCSFTSQLAINNYLLSLIIFIIGLSLNALGISLVINAGVIGFPTETLCQIIESKTNKDFKFIRTLFDVFYIMIAVIIMLFIKDASLIREGTVINLLLMGTLIGTFNPITKKIYNN